MRTISQRDMDQMAVSGARVSKVTHVAPPRGPDHSAQLADIERRLGEIVHKLPQESAASAVEIAQHSRLIEHLRGQIVALRDQLENRPMPREMLITRGPQGFIAKVTCGSLTFDFRRREYGILERIEISAN